MQQKTVVQKRQFSRMLQMDQSQSSILDSIGAIQNDMQELQYQNANLEGLLRAAKRDNCTLHNQLFELKELLKQ